MHKIYDNMFTENCYTYNKRLQNFYGLQCVQKMSLDIIFKRNQSPSIFNEKCKIIPRSFSVDNVFDHIGINVSGLSKSISFLQFQMLIVLLLTLEIICQIHHCYRIMILYLFRCCFIQSWY